MRDFGGENSAPGVPPQNSDQLAVYRGYLTYRDRIALPENATVIVSLYQKTSARQMIAEYRITASQQVPIPFSIKVPETARKNPTDWILEAEITGGENRSWVLDPPLVVSSQQQDWGVLSLRPSRNKDIGLLPRDPLRFICGTTIVKMTFEDAQHVLMQIDDKTYEMRDAVAASGVKYQALGDPDTFFWNKQDQAMVQQEGTLLEDCVQNKPRTAKIDLVRFYARGNEPPWSVNFSDSDKGHVMEIRRGYDAAPATLAVHDHTVDTWGDRQITAENRQEILVLILRPKPCTDSMSGEEFPLQATLEITARTDLGQPRQYNGCGGIQETP
jgi:uncharacterized lipoprotein YbaY/uncharacterized membrane protein